MDRASQFVRVDGRRMSLPVHPTAGFRQVSQLRSGGGDDTGSSAEGDGAGGFMRVGDLVRARRRAEVVEWMTRGSNAANGRPHSHSQSSPRPHSASPPRSQQHREEYFGGETQQRRTTSSRSPSPASARGYADEARSPSPLYPSLAFHEETTSSTRGKGKSGRGRGRGLDATMSQPHHGSVDPRTSRSSSRSSPFDHYEEEEEGRAGVHSQRTTRGGKKQSQTGRGRGAKGVTRGAKAQSLPRGGGVNGEEEEENGRGVRREGSRGKPPPRVMTKLAGLVTSKIVEQRRGGGELEKAEPCA